MSEPTTEHTYAIDPALAARWSPRAFSTTAELNQDLLGPAFEAARWSASSGNSQPWSFVVGFRGDDVFTMLTDSMNPGNSVWAINASAVAASIARTHNDEGEALSHALYDLGQAVAHFSVQASANGLVVHQMGGFDATALHGSLGLDDHHAVVTLFVVGTLGDPAELSERLREREAKPRVRKPLSDFVSGSVSYP
jgi:nitroreductase